VFGIKPAAAEHVLPMRSVFVDSPTALAADVRRRSGTRNAGALVVCLSLLNAGITTLYMKNSDYPNAGFVVTSYVSSVVGLLVGLGLAFVDDKARLSVGQRP
jgi:hypothetical protein